MRKYILAINVLFVFMVALSQEYFSQNVRVIKLDSKIEQNSLWEDPLLSIKYMCDEFAVIASSENDYSLGKRNDFVNGNSESELFLIRLDGSKKESYLNEINENINIIHREDDFIIAEVSDEYIHMLRPIVHGGLVNIQNTNLKCPKEYFRYSESTLIEDPVVREMVDQVMEDSLEYNIRHLEEYGTRDCYTSEGKEAQSWIADKFESYGLEVEAMDFSVGSATSDQISDNVIATLPGTKYPNEYVVMGGHYDSISREATAPGADDNASGTCGVIEAARIMSNYQFDRTIIFCAWSGEEYGLYGSKAFAQRAAGEGMQILGYVNLDMIGYLHPDNSIKTDIIAPASAEDLVKYYTEVASIYLPDFIVERGQLTGGDSDHTSFNQNGFMGIFPFEDASHTSPYIHSANDLVGPSVNSFEMVSVFTKAALACVSSMANMFLAPRNLYAIPRENQVRLLWQSNPDAVSYLIFRHDTEEAIAEVTDTIYTDISVTNDSLYYYHVVAVSDEGVLSPESKTVSAMPREVLPVPYVNEFNSGLSDWILEGQWGLSSNSVSKKYSISDSPFNYYYDNVNSSAILRGLDFSNTTNPGITFQTKYDLEVDYDYAYLEISADGLNWNQLDVYNGEQSAWTQKLYSLEEYVNQSYVVVRFRLNSDGNTRKDGIYIDDLEIGENLTDINDVGNTLPDDFKLAQNYPNPFNPSTTIGFNLPQAVKVKITIYNIMGQKVRTIVNKDMIVGYHKVDWNGEDDFGNKVTSGMYIYQITTPHFSSMKKMILLK